MLNNELKILKRNKSVVLKNITCVYCGCELTKINTTKEHVIGRRFVPKGSLNQDWNLILEACSQCNNKKAELENDISAITMYPGIGESSLTPELATEHMRKKDKSVSKKTGKPVSLSSETLKLKSAFGDFGSLQVDFTAPPQIASERVSELARLQIMGFFYFLTYNYTEKKGHYWPGEFYTLLEARRSDWGNITHRAFMLAVRDWEPRLLLPTANDYFIAVIRRHPSAACWSWALEWNKSMRIVGFFGEKEPIIELTSTFQLPKVNTLPSSSDSKLFYRVDIPLLDDDDCLFDWQQNEENFVVS